MQLILGRGTGNVGCVAGFAIVAALGMVTAAVDGANACGVSADGVGVVPPAQLVCVGLARLQSTKVRSFGDGLAVLLTLSLSQA